jgi:hypothetical protein
LNGELNNPSSTSVEVPPAPPARRWRILRWIIGFLVIPALGRCCPLSIALPRVPTALDFDLGFRHGLVRGTARYFSFAAARTCGSPRLASQIDRRLRRIAEDIQMLRCRFYSGRCLA